MNKNKERKTLTLDSNVKTLAIKCYDEQLPKGWEECKEKLKTIEKEKYQVMAIRHDKDKLSDSFFEPSIEKPHYHLIIRTMNGSKISKNGVHVRTILKLLGITFRPEDEQMIKNGGLETVGDFSAYALYLTHETDKAIADGKEIYDFDEIISNLSDEEIKQIRSGYKRLEPNRVTLKEMEEIDKLAYELGYELKDYDEWYQGLPLLIRANSKMKQVKESYNYGVKKRVSEDDYVARLAIFIKGEPNVGKSFACMQLLKKWGYTRVLNIGGGGTGKLDDLTATTQAIVVDDDTLPSLLNMADNKMCQPYRRNCNNPFWTGDMLLVTSNLSFSEWLRQGGFGLDVEACKQRFFICEIRNKELYCVSPSTRGGEEDQIERKERFKNFKIDYDEILKSYKKVEIDYTDINLVCLQKIEPTDECWFDCDKFDTCKIQNPFADL